MECHGDRLRGRYISTGGQGHDVSAKEFHELDVGQPTAECPFVCLSRRTLVTRGELRPVQSGAEDTVERVLAMAWCP